MPEKIEQTPYIPNIDINTGILIVDENDQRPEAKEAQEMDALLEGIAKYIVDQSLQIQKGDRLLINLSPDGWKLASKIRRLAYAVGEEGKDRPEVMLRYSDTRFLQSPIRTVLENVSNVMQGKAEAELSPSLNQRQISPSTVEATSSIEDQATAYLHHGFLSDELDDKRWATKVLNIREGSNNPEIAQTEKIYRQGQKTVGDLIDHVPTTLLYTPSQEEATAAGMSKHEYAKMYYEACNRPWNEIEKAQAVLVEILKTGKKITVTSGAPEGWDAEKWSTNVTMSIEGMEAANSVAKRNIPGSEVFLAPAADSLEGQYTLPYPVRFGNRVLPNIAFRFEKGQVVDFWIEKPNEGDEEEVRRVLGTDAGSNKVGELGIGGNAKITKAFLNSLLTEKAGGSIHLAIGDAYQTKDYEGQKIQVDNGNRSEVHFDLTRMLTPAYGGGKIVMSREKPGQPGEMEEVTLQENGRFLDERLAVLSQA